MSHTEHWARTILTSGGSRTPWTGWHHASSTSASLCSSNRWQHQRR